MLIHINGDLLKSDCNIIMHQANCFSRMESGIAKSIKEMYPEAERVDKLSGFTPEEKLGKFTMTNTYDGITIVNLYGQYAIRDEETGERGKQTNYDELESAINLFLERFNVDKHDKIGVPHGMGAGLGGGDWSTIQQLLSRQANKHGTAIYVYKLGGD